MRVPSTRPVQQQPLPGARVSMDAPVEAFGGGVSQPIAAGQKVLKTGIDMLVEEKKRADDLVATDAYAKTVSLKNDLFWNPKTGAMTKTGRNAFGVVDEYSKKFDDGTKEIEKSLANEEQRALYQKIKQKEALELSSSLQKHTFTESKKFDDDTLINAQSSAQDDAVLNYQDPGKIQGSIELQRALIVNHAERNGLPAEAVKMRVQTATSQTHRAVMDRMLANGQDQLASKYYAGIKDQLIGNDATIVEKTLEEGSLRGESQRTSDKIVSKNSSMTQAISEARKIDDPKLRDAVSDRIRQEFSLRDAARREAEERISIQGADIIDKGGRYEDIPPNLTAALPPSARTALKVYGQNKLEGKYVVTNPEVYQNVLQMLYDPARRTEAVNYNLLQHMNEIDRGQLLSLIKDQQALRKQDPTIEAKLDGYRSDKEIVNGVLEAAGFNLKAKIGSNTSKENNMFRDAVDKRLVQLAQQTGKKPTNEDVRRIANELMTEVVTKKGLIWDDTKRQFQIEAEGVPKADADIIRGKLKAKGLPATEENIMKIYLKGKASGG